MNESNKNSELSPILGISFEAMDVYCAWCKKFLYKTEGVHNNKYSVSHGICKDCSDKVFKFESESK